MNCLLTTLQETSTFSVSICLFIYSFSDSALQLENAKRMIDNLKIESDMKKKLKDDLEAAHESSLQHAYDQSQMTPETNWTSCG